MASNDVDVWGSHGSAVDVITPQMLLERGKLLTVDQARDALATTEPLAEHTFAAGDTIKFDLKPGWNHSVGAVAGGDAVEATITLGPKGSRRELKLTKDALLEAGAKAHLPAGLVTGTPGNLIAPLINHYFKDGAGEKNFKAMVKDDTVVGLTSGSIVPFSNIKLVDEMLRAVGEKYGDGPVYVDRKFNHSLRRTNLRLVIPESTRQLVDTGSENDNWSIGIDFSNSLIGEGQTSFQGYMYRWLCTNGAIDTQASSGKWSRRSMGQGDDVYEWARTAVDEVFAGLETSLDKVQALTQHRMAGDTKAVLDEIFTRYKVPVNLRDQITDALLDEENLTMYTIMQAITQAANAEGVNYNHVAQLMEIGGNVPHFEAQRCNLGRVHVH